MASLWPPWGMSLLGEVEGPGPAGAGSNFGQALQGHTRRCQVLAARPTPWIWLFPQCPTQQIGQRGQFWGKNVTLKPCSIPRAQTSSTCTAATCLKGPGDTGGCRWVREPQGRGSPKHPPHLHSVCSGTKLWPRGGRGGPG